MKKTNILMLLVVFLTAIGFTSCDSTPSYQNAIPAEPVAVIKANVKSMLDKSELLKDNQVLGKLKTEINTAPEGAREVLRAMLDNPESCGLNLEQPAFVVLENLEQAKGFLLFGVKDFEQLSAFFTSVNDGSMVISEKEGYKMITVGNENLMAFDEDKLVLAFAEAASDVTEYMREKEDAAEKADELKAFLAGKDDFGVYIDYKDIVRLTNGMAGNAAAMIDQNLFEGAKLIGVMNFEAGKIVADVKISGSEKLEDLCSKYMSSAESDLQKYVPSNSLAFMQAGVKSIGTTIKENIPEAVKTEYDAIVDNINNELASAGVSEKFSWELLNSLEGGMAAGIIKPSGTPIPQVAVYAECKDKKLFTMLLNALKANNMHFKMEADDVCSLSFSGAKQFFFGYADDKMFFLSSDIYTQVYKDKSLKSLPQNMSDNSMSSVLKSQNGMFIDCKIFVELINEMGLARRRDEKMALGLISKLTTVGYVQKGATEVELVMNLVDDKANALKQMKDAAVNMAIYENSSN